MPEAWEDYDEHKRGRYPDFGLGPCSRLPGLVDQWLWEFVARYSGATVPDSHGVPGRPAVVKGGLVSAAFKEQLFPTPGGRLCQVKSGRHGQNHEKTES